MFILERLAQSDERQFSHGRITGASNTWERQFPDWRVSPEARQSGDWRLRALHSKDYLAGADVGAGSEASFGPKFLARYWTRVSI